MSLEFWKPCCKVSTGTSVRFPKRASIFHDVSPMGMVLASLTAVVSIGLPFRSYPFRSTPDAELPNWLENWFCNVFCADNAPHISVSMVINSIFFIMEAKIQKKNETQGKLRMEFIFIKGVDKYRSEKVKE